MTTGITAPAPLRRVAGGAGARVEWTLLGLLAVTAAFAVTGVFDLVQASRIIAALPSPATHPLVVGQNLGTAEMALFYGQLIAVAIWLRMTGGVVRRFDGDPAEVLRTTPIVLWRIGAVITIAAAFALPRVYLFAADAFGVRLRWMLPILVARLALSALLIFALYGLRRRVHTLLLRSGLAPRTRRRPTANLSLLEVAKQASAIVAPLPVAGDAWCTDAVEQATAAGHPLPLLESSGDEHRRWLLVSPGDDPAALRERLLPGSLVTLFTAPALGASAAAAVRSGLVGLIEEPAGGALRHDHIDGDEQLKAWRQRAAEAPRSGLYALDDPDAMAATVPA